MGPKGKAGAKKNGGEGRKNPFAGLASAGQGGSNKVIARILVAVVLVVLLFESKNFFHFEPLKFKATKVLRIQSGDSPSGPFTPWGIAPIGKDKVVVADQEHNRLLVFDREGHFLKEWGKKSGKKKTNDFHEPSGMVGDDKGNAYVMDTWNSAIKGYDEDGKLILNIDLTKYQGFFGPRGLGFDGHSFAIADTGGHRIALIGMDGTLELSWGHQGTGAGEFSGPLAVAADTEGNYYVADTDNNRLQRLNKEGKSTKTIKFKDKVPAVAVDKQGRFYVASYEEGGVIKAYSSSGKYLGDLIDETGSPDPFRGARWMAVSPDGVLMFTAGASFSLYQLPSDK